VLFGIGSKGVDDLRRFSYLVSYAVALSASPL
jgi:hypothetical protein